MTTGRALLCAVAVLVASTAQAGPADKPGKIAHPEWKRTPTNEMLTSAMPRRAFEKGVDGRASIGCVATDLALLKDCVVDIPFHFRNSTQGDARKLNPRWVRTLSPEAMASLYPSAAAAAGCGAAWAGSAAG